MYHTTFKFKPYEEISEEEETVVVSDLNVSDVSFNYHFDQEPNEQYGEEVLLCTSYPSNNDKEETMVTEQQIAKKFEQLIIPKFISEINCPHELLDLVDMTVEIRTYVEKTSLSKVEVKKTIGFLVTPFVPMVTKVIKFMSCCHAFHENEKILDLKVVAKNKEFFGTIEQQSGRLTNLIGEGKISERLSERDFAIVSVDLNEERNRQVDTSYCLVSNKCFIPSPIAAHTKARHVGLDETPKEYNILHIGQISDLSKIDLDLVQKVFPNGIQKGENYIKLF